MAFNCSYLDTKGNAHSFVSDADCTTDALSEVQAQPDFEETLHILRIEEEEPANQGVKPDE